MRDWLCPVDGAISQFGALDGDRIFQAKGHDYTPRRWWAATPRWRSFQGGHFATLYLSPRDYHRIHMPCAGRLRRMIHVPGALFSVNPTTARGVPGLFARNERVVCLFDGDARPFVLVLVGATIVGSMATVWHGVVNPPRPGRCASGPTTTASLRLARAPRWAASCSARRWCCCSRPARCASTRLGARRRHPHGRGDGERTCAGVRNWASSISTQAGRTGPSSSSQPASNAVSVPKVSTGLASPSRDPITPGPPRSSSAAVNRRTRMPRSS
jgi:hypothetical protein